MQNKASLCGIKKICLSEVDENWFEKNISKKESRFYLFGKVIIDAFFGIVGFGFFILALPLVALAIKIETRGPVFYKQERYGKDGKIITIYKFGTMIGNDKKENEKKLWRSNDKNQITKIGKILRKTHLDELPQAINMLKGELSFIGPRAEWVELAKIFEKDILYYKKRYMVKPGLMGWAQINFPASKSVEEAREKFEYDLYYIKNRSLLLDLEIILKSLKLFIF